MALCLTLSSCESCKEEEWDTLPPETQKGANTFGCYVNGELFVPRKSVPFSPMPLLAIYEKQKLHISSISVNNQYYIDLYINNPQENEYNTLAIGYLASKNSHDCYEFGCSDCNRVFITKLDTVNRIVSGTFEFSGRCASLTFDELREPKIIFTGDSIAQITNGRFDVKLKLSLSDF